LAAQKAPDPKPKTLLVVRLDAIGDYVLFRNFLEVLKRSEKYKQYDITLCGNIVWQDLAGNLDKKYIHDFIWIDKKKFLRNVYYRFNKLIDIRRRGFEVAMQPTFSREYYLGDAIIKASGASERIGSAGDLSNMEKWQKDISDKYYTRLIQVSDAPPLEFLKNLEFFEILLGSKIHITKPSIEIPSYEAKKIQEGKYALIFPGARNERKRWDPHRFAQVAEHLSEKYYLQILIAGDQNDKKIADKIRHEARNINVFDLTGQTTLTEIIGLIAQATIVISNDTFAPHIAAAVNTKTIYLLTGEHFGRFGPYPKEITDSIYFLYPPEIMIKINSDFEALVEKYKYNSPLNVNCITVEQVKSLVDQILKD